ncbi:hypothetical protein BDV95DRAFT_611167 [Massariosphaeria phaeospora]|uniref:Inhibitor of apoptosis repeat-containing protein n=1 Tax=Massariosphaeria phaeospora TaxID=100035 RepID=A0A7C8I3A0_9PLEO|nr:hypothetical protein BDV95DRAFT_611167 [Massariosphaeria phaeospora]
MDPAYASYEARLETFLAPKTKGRRPSARSKKTTAWPLTSPSPTDLAYAGFVFKPTTASPDNVQCSYCACQLDGWEASDVPAFEHLTHAPDCGYALNVCIRIRNGDPGRTEDDPMSERMLKARYETFGDAWPLDAAAGFPGVEQLINAGWCYDPSTENAKFDGVTCPYCSLSLDEWAAGDDPMEEHHKRSADCLFFSLRELYNPQPKPAKGRKRASSRTSTASRKKAPAKVKKTKKTATTDVDTEKPLPAPPAESPARSAVPSPAQSLLQSPTHSPTQSTPRSPLQPPALSPSVSSVIEVIAPPPKKRGRKPSKRTSAVSNASATRSTRGKKRTSDSMDIEPSALPTSSRKPTSDMMDIEPTALPTSSRKRTSDMMDLEPSTLPASSPKRLCFTDMSLSTPDAESTPRTPPRPRTADDSAIAWMPIKMEQFFHQDLDTLGAISDIIIDSGLDKENMDAMMASDPEDLAEAVKAALTGAEKMMTVEEWVLYNARRGEEKLRAECERHIAAFEMEGKRALATLDMIPTA